DLPPYGLRIDRLADVLGGADPHDPRLSQLHGGLGYDTHRSARVRDVRALACDLAGIRIEWSRARMAVDPLDVDLPAAALLLPLLQRRPTRVPHGAGRHPRHSRGRCRAGGVDGRGRVRCKHDVPYAELGARDLEDDVRNALAHLGRRAVDRGAAVGME